MKKVSFLSFAKHGLGIVALGALPVTSALAHQGGSGSPIEYESSAMSYVSGVADPAHSYSASSSAFAMNSVEARAGNDWAVTSSSSEGFALKSGSAMAGYAAEGGIEASKSSRDLSYESNSYSFAGGDAHSAAPLEFVSSAGYGTNAVYGDADNCGGSTCSVSDGYADHYGNAAGSYMAGGDITGSKGTYDGVYEPYPAD